MSTFPHVQVGDEVTVDFAPGTGIAGTLEHYDLDPDNPTKLACMVLRVADADATHGPLVIRGDAIMMWRSGGPVTQVPANNRLAVPMLVPDALGWGRG